MMLHRGRTLFTALLAAAAPPALAAQDAPVATATGQSVAAVEDIVVTARRREESAQSVPVSIIALGARELEERQIHSLSDLTNIAPGVRFVAQGGSGNTNVVLRGLAKAPAGDSPNSVISYFGDIPLYFRGSDIPVFDLQNVQVLKGAQGTLFGRNSIGGAIILTPQAASDRFEGYVRTSFGNYALMDIEGAVNLPLLDDRVALRIAGKVSRRDGYVNIVNQGTNGFDNVHRDSIRATLLIKPSSTIRNTTIFDYTEADEVDANALLFAALPTGVVRTPALAQFFDCGVAPNCDIDLALARQNAIGTGDTYTWRRPYLHRRLLGIQNRTEVNFGALQFRNILGYRETGVETHNEAQGNDFGSPLATGPGRPLLASDIFVRIKQLSEEAQLLGRMLDNRLDWIVGYFHIDEDPYDDNAVRSNVATVTAAISHAYNYRTSDAVFAQFGLKIVGGLKLNGGYRHTFDRSRVCSGSSATSPTNPEPVPMVDESRCALLTNSATVRYKSDAPTYTVGLDWQIDRRIFAYVVHRRGFRAGGVNTPAFISPRTQFLVPYQSYGPEKLTDVEIGVKTDLRVAGIPVRFNISGYRSEYSEVQTSFNVANLLGAPPLPSDAPQNNVVIINTGKRRFTGFETELVIRPTDALTLGGNAAYIDQQVTDNRVPNTLPGLIAPAIVRLSPDWSASATGRWRLPFEPLRGKIFVNGDYYYQSSFFVGNGFFKAYDVANARLEWQDIAGTSFSVAAFVRNIADNRYFDSAGATAATLGFLSGHVGEPRMFGAELSVRF